MNTGPAEASSSVKRTISRLLFNGCTENVFVEAPGEGRCFQGVRPGVRQLKVKRRGCPTVGGGMGSPLTELLVRLRKLHAKVLVGDITACQLLFPPVTPLQTTRQPHPAS